MQPTTRTTIPRNFTCQCGRPIFFRNSECLACKTPLGYAPDAQALLSIEIADEAQGLWREFGIGGVGKQSGTDNGNYSSNYSSSNYNGNENCAPLYRRCAYLASASGCNWLIDASDEHAGQPPQCKSCRLTRTLPDLSMQPNPLWWQHIENAKRRLVSALIAMKLPVESKVQDPYHGLAFDLLHSLPDSHVTTGHAHGVITLDVEEADDATRESRRGALHEPYRTLLGHMRHESGHYYWERLVDGSEWLQPFRAFFGDEREDYAAALQRHYDNGPPADWNSRFVSAYASSHPWEDWAETWAHYLHMVDTLETARSFGLKTEHVELIYDPFTPEAVVIDANMPSPNDGFLAVMNNWVALASALNELSRSMGVNDFYPFVLSMPAVRKLHLVHRVVTAR